MTLGTLSSERLLARVKDLVRRGNEGEADLLAHLGEVDARRLYLEEGFPSMFAWCQRVLHFAEGVAYKRIQTARAARQFPEILEAVRKGDLHLTAVGLLAPNLTTSNCAELIGLTRHRSADEIRRLLADREPKPACVASVRRIPEPPKVVAPPVVLPVPSASPASRPPEPARAPRPEPLGADRYRVQFTADRETHAQLEELRALMRHQIPDGDIAKILSKAISVLLAQVREQKFAEVSRPRSASPSVHPSRHIPAAIRRAVWQRDGGRCTYVSADGRRCDSNSFLEFDHADAWTWTRAHSIDGITLRCRAHNQLRARRDFGPAHMKQFERRTGSESSSP